MGSTPKQGSGESEGKHRRVREPFEEDPKKRTAPVTDGESKTAKVVEGAKAGREEIKERDRGPDPRDQGFTH